MLFITAITELHYPHDEMLLVDGFILYCALKNQVSLLNLQDVDFCLLISHVHELLTVKGVLKWMI